MHQFERSARNVNRSCHPGLSSLVRLANSTSKAAVLERQMNQPQGCAVPDHKMAHCVVCVEHEVVIRRVDRDVGAYYERIRERDDAIDNEFGGETLVQHGL